MQTSERVWIWPQPARPKGGVLHGVHERVCVYLHVIGHVEMDPNRPYEAVTARE